MRGKVMIKIADDGSLAVEVMDATKGGRTTDFTEREPEKVLEAIRKLQGKSDKWSMYVLFTDRSRAEAFMADLKKLPESETSNATKETIILIKNYLQENPND